MPIPEITTYTYDKTNPGSFYRFCWMLEGTELSDTSQSVLTTRFMSAKGAYVIQIHDWMGDYLGIIAWFGHSAPLKYIENKTGVGIHSWAKNYMNFTNDLDLKNTIEKQTGSYNPNYLIIVKPAVVSDKAWWAYNSFIKPTTMKESIIAINNMDYSLAPAGIEEIYGNGIIEGHTTLGRSVYVTEKLVGGNRDDILIAGTGGSILIGGSGNDTLVSQMHNAIFIGGPGDNTYYPCYIFPKLKHHLILDPSPGADVIVPRHKDKCFITVWGNGFYIKSKIYFIDENFGVDNITVEGFNNQRKLYVYQSEESKKNKLETNSNANKYKFKTKEQASELMFCVLQYTIDGDNKIYNRQIMHPIGKEDILFLPEGCQFVSLKRPDGQIVSGIKPKLLSNPPQEIKDFLGVR